MEEKELLTAIQNINTALAAMNKKPKYSWVSWVIAAMGVIIIPSVIAFTANVKAETERNIQFKSLVISVNGKVDKTYFNHFISDANQNLKVLSVNDKELIKYYETIK